MRRVIDLKVKKVFISPIFRTTSGNKKKPIGLTRLLFLSRSLKCDIGVLGGMIIENQFLVCDTGCEMMNSLPIQLQSIEK